MLNKSFTARIRKSPQPGGWTYVIWPESSSFFGTRGLVKVKAVADGRPFRSAFMALGDGNHKLPIKREVLRAIGKAPGQTVKVMLLERIQTTRKIKRRTSVALNQPKTPNNAQEKAEWDYDLDNRLHYICDS